MQLIVASTNIAIIYYNYVFYREVPMTKCWNKRLFGIEFCWNDASDACHLEKITKHYSSCSALFVSSSNLFNTNAAASSLNLFNSKEVLSSWSFFNSSAAASSWSLFNSSAEASSSSYFNSSAAASFCNANQRLNNLQWNVYNNQLVQAA